MLILSNVGGSSPDKIRVVSSAAVTLDVHASWIDCSTASPPIPDQPGRTNTAITTATTTDIVAAPASGKIRNVKTVNIRNKHASLPCDVTVTYDQNATVYELHKVTLSPGEALEYVEGVGWFEIVAQATVGDPSWYGNLYAAYGRCDPQQLLRMAQMAGTVAPTPTNLGSTVARISYFRPPANITVNKVRFYGVGTVSSIYTFALYNGDTLARLTASTTFSTTASTWGEIFSNLALTLSKDQLYFAAASVNTTGTTAGVLSMGPTIAASTGQISVLPKSWPGNLDIDIGNMDGGFAQGAVTAGAMPDPFPTVTGQAAWTGGMPLFFLDNSNA